MHGKRRFVNVGGVAVGTQLSKTETLKIIKEFTKEAIVAAQLFEFRLWNQYRFRGKGKGTITRDYLNPILKIQFISLEETRFRNLPKDVPVPEGWRVIVCSVWNEKYAYQYPMGKRYTLEELDELEKPFVFGNMEWCGCHEVDPMELDLEVYQIMAAVGELPKGFVAKMKKALNQPNPFASTASTTDPQKKR